MIARRITNKTAGFTLIEVTVALTLTSLLFVVLMSTIRTSGHSLSVIEKISDDLEMRRTNLGFIRRKLTQAYLPSEPSNDVPPVFTGSIDELEFAVEEPARRSNGGLQLYHISGNTLNSKIVSVSAQPYKKTNSASDFVKRQSVLEGLRKIRFEYFGVQNEELSAAWHSSWKTESQLPTLVRIYYEFVSGDGVTSVIVIRGGSPVVPAFEKTG